MTSFASEHGRQRSGPDKPQPTSLSIVSYNIHKGLAIGSWRMALRRMRDMLHELAPDVVLIQEIVGRHQRLQRRHADWPVGTQVEYLADRMWPHTCYGKNAEHSAGDHGNAILSRYPIITSENIDLSVHAFEKRGILHAEIDAPHFATTLHVCCTHLNLWHAHRKRQVAAIAQRINAAVPRSSPLILGGDFNDWRVWATRELNNAIGVHEAHLSIHGRHARTFPGLRPVLALDRIYVRELQVQDARVLDDHGWRSLSDHLGLYARVSAYDPSSHER